MAPEPIRTTLTRMASAVVLAACLVTPAQALRIVNYNVTNYPGSAARLASRQPSYRTILAPLEADVFVAQEVQSQIGVDSLLTNVLNVIEPGEWAAAPFTNGNDTNNALFYKPARVQLAGSWAWYPNPLTNLRLVNCYRLRPVDSPGTEFRIYSQHLKASTGSANVTARGLEAIGIRDSMNAAPAGTPMILCGDFNIYNTGEAAYLKFMESQPNNIGRLTDPVNPSPGSVITWNNAAYAALHTQCPCVTCPSGSGFAGGGLDDRFDMFLPTTNLADGEGLDLITSTIKPVGNDGLHFNLNMTDAPVLPEGAAYATALWNASDHLPIRTDVQLPARASAPNALVFGPVIVGGTADQSLSVGNANAPLDALDDLDYSLSASPGFTAPVGTFSVLEGANGTHTIGMSTASAGNLLGNLLIQTDDPANPALNVALQGTVLRHAAASFDSLLALGTRLVDFGTHPAGEFANQDLRTHNRGFDALQAQLQLTAASIAGGAGRFTVVSGSTPVTLGGTGQTFSVAFNDVGATLDSLYEATLTVSSVDAPLPGATAQADLVATLRAQVASGGNVGVDAAPPTATLLYAPYPNPLVTTGTVRFDLARDGDVAVEVLDVTGRRIATLLDHSLSAGRYSLRWDGRDATGQRANAGLYFVRMRVAGQEHQSARIAVVH